MNRWAIYYSDGSVFRSEEGDPADAPSEGVITCVVEDPRTDVSILRGADFYWFEPDQDAWVAGDLVGVLDFMRRSGMVKVGRVVNDDTFYRVLNAAKEDPLTARKRFSEQVHTRFPEPGQEFPS